MASELSAFDIIGPRMTGPSSSHTAGAARIGRFARKLLGQQVKHARVQLHGSFAATGSGHATDKAIVNGLLDQPIDSDRLKLSLEDANRAGLDFSIEEVDLGERVHPNTARLEIRGSGDKTLNMQAASIGGGEVEITEIDGFATSFRAKGYVLVVWNRDSCGFLAHLTSQIAKESVNIAEMHVTRNHRAGEVLTVCVLDAPIRLATLTAISRLPQQLNSRFIATDNG